MPLTAADSRIPAGPGHAPRVSPPAPTVGGRPTPGRRAEARPRSPSRREHPGTRPGVARGRGRPLHFLAGESATSKYSGKPGGRAPEQTFEEVRYLRHLIEREIPVRVKLTDGEEVAGVIEYYDQSFIRLTRADGPNLFIYKHEIKYLTEEKP